jgi:hypothetical protein
VTKEHVLKTLAAAVMGQASHHFGLDFDNPLERLLD